MKETKRLEPEVYCNNHCIHVMNICSLRPNKRHERAAVCKGVQTMVFRTAACILNSNSKQDITLSQFSDTHLQTLKQEAFGLKLQNFAGIFLFLVLRASQCGLHQATLYMSIVKTNDHHLLLAQCLARPYKHLQQHGSQQIVESLPFGNL